MLLNGSEIAFEALNFTKNMLQEKFLGNTISKSTPQANFFEKDRAKERRRRKFWSPPVKGDFKSDM